MACLLLWCCKRFLHKRKMMRLKTTFLQIFLYKKWLFSSKVRTFMRSLYNNSFFAKEQWMWLTFFIVFWQNTIYDILKVHKTILHKWPKAIGGDTGFSTTTGSSYLAQWRHLLSGFWKILIISEKFSGLWKRKRPMDREKKFVEKQ